MNTITKADALKYIGFLLEDLDMLLSGEWQPDDDSCNASIANAEAVKQFLEELHD